MAFIGNDLTTIVKQGKKSYVYTATASQTDFTGSDDNGESLAISVDSFVNVFLNGIRLIKTTDYTLSENTVTLTSAASEDDELVIVADIEASTFNTYTKSEVEARITSQVNGLIDAAPEALNTLNELAAALGDDANFATTVTNALNARYTSTEVDNLLANINSVQVSGTEPTGKSAGLLWYNTGNTTLYVANGSEYLKVSAAIPTLAGVTGTIYAGAASTLTLSGTNFLTDNLVVTFTSNSTDYDVTVTPSSDTSATVAVPSGLYNVLTGGDNVSITVTNSDDVTSGGQNKTAVSLPSGGTVTTYGAYRVHTFTSSGSLTVPNTITADILMVAGGGGGGSGYQGGGGGAGGMLTLTSQSISAGTKTITVGAGGSGGPGNGGGDASSGQSTSFTGLTTAIGGGRGGGQDTVSGEYDAESGGSGGGGNHSSGISGKSGTSGQGNSGGNGYNPVPHCGGGGGGKGAAGENAPSNRGGNGGVGAQNDYRTGSNVYYAGGGAGSYRGLNSSIGGLGGGGSKPGSSQSGDSGASNTGGGGAAGRGDDYGGSNAGVGGNGGSGIVIIRYQL